MGAQGSPPPSTDMQAFERRHCGITWAELARNPSQKGDLLEELCHKTHPGGCPARLRATCLQGPGTAKSHALQKSVLEVMPHAAGRCPRPQPGTGRPPTSQEDTRETSRAHQGQDVSSPAPQSLRSADDTGPLPAGRGAGHHGRQPLLQATRGRASLPRAAVSWLLARPPFHRSAHRPCGHAPPSPLCCPPSRGLGSPIHSPRDPSKTRITSRPSPLQAQAQLPSPLATCPALLRPGLWERGSPRCPS